MRLPVSGLEIAFRTPDGNDDLAVLEATGSAVERGLVALTRLAEFVPATPARAWNDLTVTDFETALLGLRQLLFGNRVACVFLAKSHPCSGPMELEFSIAELLETAEPRIPRGVMRLDDKGDDPRWFAFATVAPPEFRFRLPNVADQLAVAGLPDSSSLLAARCLSRADATSRLRTRAERAMQALAPPVSRSLAGQCPECGQAIAVALNVPRLVAEELRLSATGLHEEVHAIAALYHWDQTTILALPQSRRRAYAELIERERREVA